jgi:glycerol-3-phosphate dehydrogenase
MKDVIIIGAGAVGSFIARSLSRYELSLLVIEKENDVGDVTTMANSAISHSGYDPVPGTKKAIFNVAGNKMMPEVCKELDIPYGKVGTLTVAIEDEQLPMLQELLERAKQNGVKARSSRSAEEFKKMEPNINPEAKGALLCPDGGIVNPFLLPVRAMENAMDNGVELHLERRSDRGSSKS